MKKYIIFFLLIFSFPLFAETKTFFVGDEIKVLFKPNQTLDRAKGFKSYVITGILPSENGYILKLQSELTKIELYIKPGFIFYEYSQDLTDPTNYFSNFIFTYYKNEIKNITPNSFTTNVSKEQKEYGRE